MRKFLTVGLAAMALVLAGCSVGGGGGDEAKGGDGPLEIKFSHWALTAPPFDAFVDIMDDFNASQDDYKVVPENIPYANYHQTVFTQAGAGEGATLMSVDSAELPVAIGSGLAEDLAGKVTLPDKMSSYEASLDQDGKRYAVTFTRHPYVMMVNTAMLKEKGLEVPTTFDEFKAMTEAWADPPNTFGFAFRHTTADTNGWWLDLTNWIHGSGGFWSDESGPTIDTPEVALAISRMKEFIDEDLIPVGAAAPDYRRMYWEGKIPALIESTAFAGIFAAQSPELGKVQETYRIPFEDDSYVSSNNPVFVNASASDEQKEGAIAFLNYMLKPDVQQKMIDTLAGSLVSADIPLSEKTFESNPWLRTWEPEDSGLDFAPPGVGEDLQRFRKAIMDELEKVFAGQVSVDEGLKAAQAAAEKSLQ